MNSRERILTALNHNEPDRVPVDFNGHRSSGIMVQAYKKLRNYLDLPPSNLYIYDFIQQLALVEDDVLDIVGADVVELGHNYYKKAEYWKDWELSDGTICKIPAAVEVEKTRDGDVIYGDEDQIIAIRKNGCLFVEQTYYPLCKSDDEIFDELPYYLKQIMWCRIGSPPWPAGFDGAGLKEWRDAASELRLSTDRAIYGIFGGNLMDIGLLAFGNENWYCEMALNPERVHAFLDRLTQIHMDNLTKFIEATGEHIDIIGFADDLGMMTGPQISPAMYREYLKPYHKRLWTHVKKMNPKLKVSLHCCGGVYPLLRDLIDAGLEIINPVQISCKDMELPRLKKEFGKELVFWGGGCDTREILSFGTPESIRRHVKENIEVMSPGGGFVFQQVHNIMADIPPENIMAMFESAKE